MKIDKNLVSGTTPMLVLALLRDGDKYGYQMISDLAICSDGAFDLKEGTLYPILHALEKSGALKSYNKETPQGKTRKYYTLTKAGRVSLEEKEAQWSHYTTSVAKVIAQKI